MAYEIRDESGSLFRNERMREGKQDAQYTGSAKIGGTEYWVNAWVNETKDGQKYFGLKFNPKQGQVKDNRPSSLTAAQALDDEIPF